MNHNSSSRASISATSNLHQFQYYNHYNHDLLDRIISGRKSVHPKWRRKARRAATLLGIPKNCNLDVNASSNTSADCDDGCDSGSSADSSSFFSTASTATHSPSLMVQNIESMEKWNGVVTVNDQNPTSLTTASTTPSTSPLLYKDGNIWKVSRGGGNSSTNNHDDRKEKTLQSKKRRRQQQQIEFHTQPVPPASSTILRSIYKDDDDDTIATTNTINDKEYMHTLCKTRPFKRRKLQILKYSQHRRRQQHLDEEDNDEDDKNLLDTHNDKSNNPCDEQLSAFLLSPSNNDDDPTNQVYDDNKGEKRPLSLSTLFRKANHKSNNIINHNQIITPSLSLSHSHSHSQTHTRTRCTYGVPRVE